MKRIIIVLLNICIIISSSGCWTQPRAEKYQAYYFDWFDTVTIITGYEESKAEFDKIVDEIAPIFDKYHRLYNIHLKYDGLNNLAVVNGKTNGSHSIIKVESEIIDLIKFSQGMYKLTNSKLNIAMGSVLSIWHYYREVGLENPDKAELPDAEKLIEAAQHMNMSDIIIDEAENTVYLADPKMSLDVGAVAKGYACEQVARYLEQKGIEGYVINAGGNVRTIGSKPDGKGWTVGIENPNLEDEDNPYVAMLELNGQSLVTSGSYQRFYTVDGKNYHHIIDPDTLMPSERYLSVSILCSDSGLGDGLSTALFNMDYEDGRQLVESLSDVEALWIMPDGEVKYSNGFGAFLDKE